MTNANSRVFVAVSLLIAAGLAQAQCNPQWVEITAPGPGARFVPAMAHDPARNVDVLFGGAQQITGPGFHGDTWEFDRATGAWSQRATTGPAPRYGVTAFFMPSRAGGSVHIFGGSTVESGLGSQNDTWRWDGAAWQFVTSGGPSPRYGASIAFDSARGRAVLFGGIAGSTPQADTWEFDGANWSLMPNSGPAARGYAGIAYHETLARTILFGGNAGGPIGDTWLWDGASWSSSAGASPPPRIAPAMAYSAAGQHIILYGGLAGAGLDDLWIFDTQWQQIPQLPPQPVGLAGAGIAINPAGDIVLMGGWDGATTRHETWELSCGSAPCYANCDGSTLTPILNVDDFTCFINEYAAATSLPHPQQLTAYANCDQSTITPVLNVDDFTCFINQFAQGCP